MREKRKNIKNQFSLLLSLSLTLFNCGGSSGGKSDTIQNDSITYDLPEVIDVIEPLVTKQESLKIEDFSSILDSDSDLKAIVNKLAQDGFTEFLKAGTIEDQNGNTVFWGIYQNESGESKDAVRFCDQTSCVHVIQEISIEKAVWFDKDGNQVDVKSLATPSLLKHLKGHDVEKDKTEVLLPLKDNSDLILEKGIDLKERRFIIANFFGNTWGLNIDEIKNTVLKSNIFTKIEENDFLTKEELEEYFALMHPYEILLIVSQGIREVLKTQGPIFRSIGFNTSISGYGEKVFTVDDFEKMIGTRILGGAGLVFILASNIIVDVPPELKTAKNMINSLNLYPQPIISFTGHGHTKLLITATNLFFEKYLNRGTIGDAVKFVNFYLSLYGGTLQLRLNQSPMTGKYTKIEDFWGEKPPKGGDFNSFISFNRKCPSTDEDQKQANLWIKEIFFDGSQFSGSYEKEGSNPGDKLRLSMEGILLQIEKNIHFYFVADGDINTEVRGIKIFGDAKILKTKEKDGSIDIIFDGTAKTTTYKNSSGEECTLKNVFLSPMIQGEGESKFTINF